MRDAPSVLFPATESFAKVLSAANRDLIGLIAEHKGSHENNRFVSKAFPKGEGRCGRSGYFRGCPKTDSLDELAAITGRATSNLTRTLKTMAAYGLVALERGERGRIIPRVTHDRIELALPLTRP